jgi:hypothetical protein
MTEAASIIVVLCFLTFGTVVYRALVLWMCQFDSPPNRPTDRDILLQGALPAVAIVGTCGTYLSHIHGLRADIMAVGMAVVLIWRQNDAYALARALGALFADIWRNFWRGNIFPLAAISGVAVLAVILLAMARIPAASVDVWAFQLPLSLSLVSHHGFVYPQIDNLFYANNPLFINVLFAQAMAFVEHFFAANTVNITIYLAFLASLANLAPRGRHLVLLLALYFIAASPFFSASAAVPLTDMARSCFSVAALLFADKYLTSQRLCDLGTAALLCGAAVASKYTELLVLGLIVIALLPRLIYFRKGWRDLMVFSSIVVVVAGYWYLKNLILLGNPLYPFVFGHPGLSDEWMADYMREMTRAFEPADRIYVTDLRTLAGWQDFALILYDRFFAGKTAAKLAAFLIAAGLFFSRARMRLLFGWTTVLFVVWYAVMFNHIRWAMPAYLLFFSTAIIACMRLRELTYAPLLSIIERGAAAILSLCPKSLLWTAISRRFHGSASIGPIIIVALFFAIISVRAYRHGTAGVIPGWIEIDAMHASFTPGGVDAYLSARREGYELYRYIARNDLRMVLQPFDNGARLYAAAYAGGRDGGWILSHVDLPSASETVDEFVRRRGVRYFIFKKDLRDVEIDRYGLSHVNRSRSVFDALLPHSTKIMEDRFGWSLYALQARNPPPLPSSP